MYQTVRPVDVISVCSVDGTIRPLRLRVEDEMKRLHTVQIDEVVSMQDIHYVGVEAQVFLCRATVNNRKWMFELKYTIRSHSWGLLQRVAGRERATYRI